MGVAKKDDSCEPFPIVKKLNHSLRKRKSQSHKLLGEEKVKEEPEEPGQWLGGLRCVDSVVKAVASRIYWYPFTWHM